MSDHLNDKVRRGAADIADDMLAGIGPIAGHIGKTERQAYYACETGKIPAFKFLNKWHMRKSTYRAFIERLEATACAQTDDGR